jgi:amidase
MPAFKDRYRCFMPFPDVPVPHTPSGPLSGLTLAVKDIFDVKGYPTSAGSPTVLAMSGIKKRTAPFAAQMLKAGARFVGKTLTDELAFSLNGKNAHFGSPINPAAPDRITGGSSCGSAAAVAGNLADIALGSDTGGSVRGPASYCGLFGIRPTHARLSLKDCWPLSASLDTAGFFTRDGETFLKVAETVLGKDRAVLPARPRFLVDPALIDLATGDAKPLVTDAIRRAGLALGEPEEVSVAKNIDDLYWAFRWIQGREAWESDGAMIEAHNPVLGPGVVDRFAFSKGVTDEQVTKASRIRTRFRDALKRTLGADGVLVLPTMPDIAPLASASEADLEDFRNRALRLLCLSGLSGFPQISLPALRRDGAPLGLSLIGPKGSDLSLARLAVAYENAVRIRIA